MDWVNETAVKLLSSRNEAECLAGDELVKCLPDIEKQAFFRIRGRCYFLDYFIPKYKVAIEIDGDYHKTRCQADKQRDEDFFFIGIRTLRISDNDVLDGNLFKVLKEKLKPKPKKQKKKKVTKQKCPKKTNQLKSAWKRLREHDKMKHLASWI